MIDYTCCYLAAWCNMVEWLQAWGSLGWLICREVWCIDMSVEPLYILVRQVGLANVGGWDQLLSNDNFKQGDNYGQMMYFGDFETKIEWWWWLIPSIVKKLHGGCSNGGGDDDGERVWIELNTHGYDDTSDFQH